MPGRPTALGRAPVDVARAVPVTALVTAPTAVLLAALMAMLLAVTAPAPGHGGERPTGLGAVTASAVGVAVDGSAEPAPSAPSPPEVAGDDAAAEDHPDPWLRHDALGVAGQAHGSAARSRTSHPALAGALLTVPD